jgi:hypothetical protein
VIESRLLEDRGILVVSPSGPLATSDFAKLAREIDPYIEREGQLHGLMIEAPSFPGWTGFAALLSHLRFVRDHHTRIERVAVVSDSAVLTIMPQLAAHFVRAEVRHFAEADRDAALHWLADG